MRQKPTAGVSGGRVGISICIKLGCQDLLADWVRHVRAREMWLTGFDRSWFGEQGAGLVARIKRSVCTC